MPDAGDPSSAPQVIGDLSHSDVSCSSELPRPASSSSVHFIVPSVIEETNGVSGHLSSVVPVQSTEVSERVSLPDSVSDNNSNHDTAESATGSIVIPSSTGTGNVKRSSSKRKQRSQNKKRSRQQAVHCSDDQPSVHK